MKRIIVLAIAALLTTGAWAQGTFTVRRPLDGAKVRETVSVRIPKNSIPDGGYIGVYVNGQFVEATLPDVEGDDYVYKWNTQAKDAATGMALWNDGPAKIECLLYVDVNGKNQVVNRSSVSVTVDNKTSIKVPDSGFKLRYRFNAGTERVYQWSVQQEVGMISQAQAQLGSRAPMVSSDEVKVRILYATDNSYTVNGAKQGLLRLQIIPDKGKDYATIIPADSSEPKRLYGDSFMPFYMRVTDVGREVFSSLPIYFGMDGTNGAIPEIEYFPLLPLPVLPTKSVKPGDFWQANQLFGQYNKESSFKEDKFTISVPARGEFQEVTWYKGMPCAVLNTVIAAGPELLKNAKNLNQVKGEASNIKLQGKIWFALDRGAIARMEVEMSQESLVDAGGGGGGGAAGGAAGARKGGPAGAGGGGGVSQGIGDWVTPPSGGWFQFSPSIDNDGNATFFQVGGRGKRGGASGAGGGLAGAGQEGDEGSARGGQPGPGGRFGQRTGGGNAAARKMVMRIRQLYVAELEQ